MAETGVADSMRDLADRVVKGDRRALSRAISIVENRAPGFRSMLSRLYPRGGRAYRVGITGPPGSGKSTLVNALADLCVQAGDRVGVVAIDPTSPFTGGALLGDRVRMHDASNRPEVFVRSMATRGSSGGLAASTRDVCALLDAAQFEWLMVETVGVGQVEVSVMDVCDVVVVVLVPESGDGVQALKAGLIEIAHLFVVNKADRPGAEQLAAELTHMIAERPGHSAWRPPVLLTEAVRGTGTDRILEELRRYRDFLGGQDRLRDTRRRQARSEIENLLTERLYTYLSTHSIKGASIDDLAARVAAAEMDPHQAADQLWRHVREEPGS